MKFNIQATIKLSTNIEPDHLKTVLDPENTTPDQTKIQTQVIEDQVVTTIDGKMKVATLLRSIDDILQTAILSSNISTTMSSEDIQDPLQ